MAAKKRKNTSETEQKSTLVEKKPRKMREDEVRECFRKYFTKLKRQLKLDSSLEKVLWLHLKSIECDKVELFDQGVKNFGYDTP